MAERMFSNAVSSAMGSLTSIAGTVTDVATKVATGGVSPEMLAQDQAASSMNGAVESKAAQRTNFAQFLQQSRTKQDAPTEGSRRPNTFDLSVSNNPGDIKHGDKE